MRRRQTVLSSVLAVVVFGALIALLLFGPAGRDVATPQGTTAVSTPVTVDPGRASIRPKYPKCRNVEPAENAVTCRGVRQTFTIARGSTLLVNNVGLQVRFARLNRSVAGRTEIALSGYLGASDTAYEPTLVADRIYIAVGTFVRYRVTDLRLASARQGVRSFTLNFRVPTSTLARLTSQRGRARLTFNRGAFGDGPAEYVGVLSIRLPPLRPGRTTERLY